MNKRETAKLMRAHGMTFDQIGAVMGCSKQNAEQLVKAEFIFIKPDESIYPNLTDFMNRSYLTRSALLRLMGLYRANNVAKLSRIMLGTEQPKKNWIDALLRVTGLTYETLFSTVGGAHLPPAHPIDTEVAP